MGLGSFFKRGKKEDKHENTNSNITINTEDCGGCGKCSIACPNNMFIIEDGISKVRDFGICRNCKVCMTVCPNDCILVS